jgi:NAD(P)-dependent dehydrogenase (short-subunit alcohol dehydrogenase family)
MNMADKALVHKQYLGQVRDYPLRDTRRNALILGASGRNIGAAISLRLERDDFLTCERDKFDGDMSLSSSSRNLFKYHREYPFDTLVSCMGSTHLDWFEDQSAEVMERVVADTLMAPMLAANEFVRHTIHTGCRKHIVFIGSMAYNHVLNASAPYCAAKAGLNQLAKCLAWELAHKGYDVYIVHPSNTEDTPMSDKTIQDIMRYRGLDLEEAREYWSSVNVKGHFLQKQEIAETVSWLVSGKACHLSGTAIEMAGGQR